VGEKIGKIGIGLMAQPDIGDKSFCRKKDSERSGGNPKKKKDSIKNEIEMM